MGSPVNFYREVDLVKESVIPKQNGVVLSSSAQEASVASAKESRPASGKVVGLVGDNELVDGISVRYPEYLASIFHNMRTKLTRTVDTITNKVDEKATTYYKQEARITSTISNLHSDPREELLPGFTYIAVAAMAGSIFAKNKNILLRITAPIFLGSLCFGYVLPTTFKNTANLLHDIESACFPRIVAKQDALFLKTQELSCKTAKTVESTVQGVSSSVSKLQHQIKKWTGMNVE